MLNQITIFGIISFINFILTFFLGSLAFIKSHRSNVKKSYAAFAFALSFYAFFYFLWQSSSEKNWAIFLFKWTIVGVVLINTTLFQFTYALLSLNRQKTFKIHIYFVHLVNLFFCYAALFLFYQDWVIKFSYGLWPIPSNVFHVYLIWWFLQVFYCFWLIWTEGIVRAVSKQVQQCKWVLVTSLIGYIGGATNWFVWYGINFPPYLNGGIAVYAILLGYAIFRHQLFDIEVIIRRTLVFAGLFSFAFAVFAFSTFLTQEVLNAYVSGRGGRVLSLVISVFLIVLVYEPLRKFLINLTDKFLFQKKYDYRKLLRDASAGISQIKSLHQLLSLVTHFTTMRIRVRNAAILIHDERNDYFKLAYMRGYEPDIWLKKDHIFNESDELIHYLANERIPIDIEKAKEYVDTGGPKTKKGGLQAKYDYKAIQQRMEDLRAACCVPSFLGNNLRNVLVLGEKKSGDFFSDEDLHVLYTLAQESAIAIENARLYDQAIEKAHELEGINEQLNTAQTNLLRALNETEIANKRLRDTHAQLIHEQKMATLGRLASSVGHEVNNPLTILSMNVSRAILKYRQNPDLKVTDILDIFHKMEQNISRIKAVVNTLTGLLKKSEHGKFEALSLKLVLEETLPLVQFQTYLENLSGTEVNFEIPGNIPLIKGDLERLQEVFLNLFINAYHAMASKRDRKITVTAHEDPAHPAMVVVQFSDNGHGMSDDVMKKIFSYGFTTKPAGKGSGMGLYMCRYIIELHGGDIKVRSKPGEGTSFVITLPIAHDQSSISQSSADEK